MLLSTVEKREQRQREWVLSSRIRKSLTGRGTSEWRPDWALQVQAETPLERRETKSRGAESGVKGRGQGWRPWTVQRSGRRREKSQGGLGVTQRVWGPRSQGKKVFPERRCDHVRGRLELRMTLDLARLLWSGHLGDCGVKRERETTNKDCSAGELFSIQRLMRWPWGKGISQILGATILWLADGNVTPRGQQWWAGGSEGSCWTAVLEETELGSLGWGRAQRGS